MIKYRLETTQMFNQDGIVVERESFHFTLNSHPTVQYVVRETGGRKLASCRLMKDAIQYATDWISDMSAVPTVK